MVSVERLSSQRRAIVLLAGSLFDSLGPRVRRGPSDLAPAEWAACPDCSRPPAKSVPPQPGWRLDRFGRRSPCVTCGGRLEERDEAGRLVVRAWKGRGRVKVDPMDRERRPIGSVETPDAPPRVETRGCWACQPTGADWDDRLPLDQRPARTWGTLPKGTGVRGEDPCPVCGGGGELSWSPFELRIDEGGGSDPEEALIEAIERRNETGDWARLEQALAELRQADVVDGTQLHRLWVSRYVYGAADTPDERETELLEVAWRLIEARMPERPRVPAWVRHAEKRRREQVEKLKGRWTDPAALRQRDREIRRRYNAGEQTVEELVRTFGVSRSTVYEAIHRGAA